MHLSRPCVRCCSWLETFRLRTFARGQPHLLSVGLGGHRAFVMRKVTIGEGSHQELVQPFALTGQAQWANAGALHYTYGP